MNKVELKSNRKFIIYMYLPLAVIINIFIIIIIVGMLIDYNNMSEKLSIFYIFIFLDICYFAAILFGKYYKGKSYIFDTSSIYIFNKGILKEKINVLNIDKMYYYRFKFHYFFTMFAGSLKEGGAMKIHIIEKNGVKHTLGFIGYKDAKILQQMYLGLLKLY